MQRWVVRVPRTEAERIRRRLASSGLLLRRARAVREGDEVLFALAQDGLTEPPADVGFPVELREVDERRGPTSYKALVAVPGLSEAQRALLPTAYDRVGDVVIIRLDEELLPVRAGIGRALLRAHPTARTVAVDSGVEGTFRVRHLEVIAGEGSLVTDHREHGLVYRVDLATCYFSPRLATERERVATQVGQEETVLDMFAGVGPFAILIARRARPVKVFAVESNPAAIACLAENIRRNNVPSVTVVAGDARTIVPKLGPVQRAIMNLPHDAEKFLDVVAGAIRPGGTIHLYAIGEEPAAPGAEAVRLLDHAGRRAKVVASRRVKSYSPGRAVFGIDLVVAEEDDDLRGGRKGGQRSST